MTDETKDKMTDALAEGVKAGYEASRGKSLAWWERLLWVLLSGLATAAAALLTGCAASYSQGADGRVDAALIIIPRSK